MAIRFLKREIERYIERWEKARKEARRNLHTIDRRVFCNSDAFYSDCDMRPIATRELSKEEQIGQALAYDDKLQALLTPDAETKAKVNKLRNRDKVDFKEQIEKIYIERLERLLSSGEIKDIRTRNFIENCIKFHVFIEA